MHEMRLRKSRLAETDLAAIADFGVDNFGAERALAYINAIESRCLELLLHPELGRAERDLRPDIRSMSAGSHRIYYSVEGDELVVRRVLHKAMDVGKRLS